MYVYDNCCVPTIKSQSIVVNGSALQITVPSLTLLNGKEWRLILCQCVPEAGKLLPVQIISGETTLPVLTNLGNTLRGDMLRGRKAYTLAYGWDEPHFIILSCNLCESAFVPSTASAAASTVSQASLKTKADK